MSGLLKKDGEALAPAVNKNHTKMNGNIILLSMDSPWFIFVTIKNHCFGLFDPLPQTEVFFGLAGNDKT